MKKATPLTKEYLEGYLDKSFQLQTKELKAYADKKHDDMKGFVKSEIAELARMVAEGFHDVGKRLDVTSRMDRVEKFVYKVAEALHIPA